MSDIKKAEKEARELLKSCRQFQERILEAVKELRSVDPGLVESLLKTSHDFTAAGQAVAEAAMRLLNCKQDYERANETFSAAKRTILEALEEALQGEIEDSPDG